MTRGTVVLLLAAVLLGGAWGATRGGPAPVAPVPARSAPAATPADAELPPSRGSARELFAHTCGMCHTLRAAGSRGLTGPDLDELRPGAAQVRRMVRTGSLDGVMQPGLLRGRAARSVARFVARRAGR